MKTTQKIVCFFISGMLVSLPSYAVIDPARVLEETMIATQLVIENVGGIANLVERVQANVLQGPMGQVYSKVVDLKTKIEDKDFAPLLPKELSSIVNKGQALQKSVDGVKEKVASAGKEIQDLKVEGENVLQSVPQVVQYSKNKMLNMNFSDPEKMRDALVEVDERLNLGAQKSLSQAKALLAKSNASHEQFSKQLKQAGSAKNLQEKFVAEMDVDIQSLKSYASKNQLYSKLLETKALNSISKKQKSGETVNMGAKEAK